MAPTGWTDYQLPAQSWTPVRSLSPATRGTQIIPAGVPYREAVEEFTRFRMGVVNDNDSVSIRTKSAEEGTVV